MSYSEKKKKKVVVEANPAGHRKKIGLLSADPQQYMV